MGINISTFKQNLKTGWKKFLTDYVTSVKSTDTQESAIENQSENFAEIISREVNNFTGTITKSLTLTPIKWSLTVNNLGYYTYTIRDVDITRSCVIVVSKRNNSQDALFSTAEFTSSGVGNTGLFTLECKNRPTEDLYIVYTIFSNTTNVVQGILMLGTGDYGGVPGTTPHIGENGNWFLGEVDTGTRAQGPQGIRGIQGVAGKTAYESAFDGGYTGTEAQFNTDLADVSTKESTSNKKTNIEANKTSNVFFATVKAIYDWCVGKFQEKLVSGINLKTLNNESLLGGGNIEISGGGGVVDNDSLAGEGTAINPFQISEEYKRRINAGI